MLEALFPARFDLAPDAEKDPPRNGVGTIWSVNGPGEGERVGASGVRKLIIDRSGARVTQAPGNGILRFTSDEALASCLRRRELAHAAVIDDLRAVRLQDGDRVLATFADQPVWVLRPGPEGFTEVVSFPCPVFAPEEAMIDHFHGGKFLQLLPFVHFVRRIVRQAGWQFPVPRACLMFDDPNLHWPTYGFVSYPKIIESAHRIGYHATFATVPLDGWFVHQPTAALFREHPGQISLLIHGNNHLYAELARVPKAADCTAVATEALRRIASLERRAGLRVNRVIAPPHGACSLTMLRAMLAQGMEGAFISPWSLRLWNRSHDWNDCLGGGPAELVEQGFPVAPRFRLSAEDEGSILLATLLGRPIVPVGHHGNLCDGLDILEKVAAMINRLGNVVWTTPETILRSNFLSRVCDGILSLRPFSARFQFTIPAGVESTVIEAPTKHAASSENDLPMRYRAHSPRTGKSLVIEAGEPFSVKGGGDWEVVNSTLGGSSPPAGGRRPAVAWAFTRRLLCEARDRFAPARKMIAGNWR